MDQPQGLSLGIPELALIAALGIVALLLVAWLVRHFIYSARKGWLDAQRDAQRAAERGQNKG